MFSRKVILLIIIVAITAILIAVGSKIKNDEAEETYDLLPALNYYSLDKPRYFFYDPVLSNVYEKKKPAKLRKNDLPGMETVFGPKNYLRYQLRDIDLELPEASDDVDFS